MATNPPVAAQNSAPAQAVARAWVLESVVKGPDGKDMPLTSQLAPGQSQTITVQSGIQYKLAPATKPNKGQATKSSPDDQVLNMPDGNDLRVMLPGGGLVLFKGFYANKNKASPTKLQISQSDGRQESVFSVAPAQAAAKVQEIDSKALDAALNANGAGGSKDQGSLPETTKDAGSAGAVSDSKSKGKGKGKGKKGSKNEEEEEEDGWFDNIDWSWLGLGGLIGLLGLLGGKSSGGTTVNVTNNIDNSSGGGGGGGGSGNGTTPAAVSTVSLSHDSGVAADFVTNVSAQTISGTLSAALVTGDVVKLSLDNGVTWLTATSTVGGTTFSLSNVSLSGSNTLKAKVTNSAGVDGTVYSHAFVFDNTPPTTPVVTLGTGVADGATALEATDSTGVVLITVDAGSTNLVTLTGTSGVVTKTITGTGSAQAVVLSEADLTELGSGTVAVSVVSTDLAGNNSTAGTHSFDLDETSLPPASTTVVSVGFSADTGRSTNDLITKIASQTVRGTLSAPLRTGETVYVSMDAGTNWEIATTTVGSNIYSLSGVTLVGSHTVKVKVIDASNVESDVLSRAYTLDTVVAATPVIALGSGVSDGADITEATQTSGVITVNAELASSTTVLFSRAGNTVRKVFTGTGASKAVTLTMDDVITLGDGVVSVSAISTDAAGNASNSQTSNFTLDTSGFSPFSSGTTAQSVSFSDDSGSSGTDFITNVASQTVSGVLTANLRVGEIVYICSDGINWNAATANVGSPNFSLAGVILDASQELRVKVVNATGLDGPEFVQNYVLDTTAPTATLSTTNSLANTGNAVVQSTEAGTAYLVDTTVNVGNLTHITSAANDVWNSVALSAADTNTTLALTGLADGTYTLYAVDAAGNLSLASANTLTIASVQDITAPTVSSVVLSSATGIQNNTLNVGDVVTATVTMSESVTVSTAGGAPQLALNIGGTTVQADYASGSGSTTLTFTYTILANQTDTNGISVDANALSLNGGTIADAASNNAVLTHTAVSNNASFLVDTTLPSAPTLALTSDNGSSNTDNITSSTGVTISGVEAGATWQYSSDSGSTWSAAQTAATTTFTLAEGTYATGAVQVRQTDVAGNISTVSSSTSSWTIDTTAPTTTISTAAF
ncbi:MAG: hypothetical protein RLZZ470_1233, partial [Pseudomonadota bacterium]